MNEQNQLPDDLNPEYLFNGIHWSILSKAVKGEIDLMHLAKKALANEGRDADGNWVGFKEAKELHGIK